MLDPPNQPVYHHLGISTGVLRKIGFVLLIVALVAVAARKSWIEPQNGHISRPNRYRKDTNDACPSNRPFVCYVFDELERPYPELSGPKDTQCSPCTVSASELCTEDRKFYAAKDLRPQTMGCRPNLCKQGETVTADCIAPVTIDVINETVYFPFNLCTREIVASGLCADKPLSADAYLSELIPHTTQYFLQCDAGFVIPQIVQDAIAKNPGLPFTCIPSLKRAAGYIQTDETSFDKNPYDVFDPTAPTYCSKGGRPAGVKCDPLPVCTPAGVERKIFPGGEKLVKPATECDQQCEFPRVGGQYPPDDCVLLDISDPTGTPPYYSLRRALSGPYATLMSEEETINYLVNLRPKNDSQPSITTDSLSPVIGHLTTSPQPETPEDDTGNSTEPTNSEKKLRWKRSDKRSRQKRQGTPLPSVIYPRCIKTDGLPEDQRAIVEADELLNCAKNPFYKQFGIMALTVSKLLPCSEVDQNQQFCLSTPPAPVVTTGPLPTQAQADGLPPLIWLYIAIGTTIFVLLAASGGAYALKKRREKKKLLSEKGSASEEGPLRAGDPVSSTESAEAPKPPEAPKSPEATKPPEAPKLPVPPLKLVMFTEATDEFPITKSMGDGEAVIFENPQEALDKLLTPPLRHFKKVKEGQVLPLELSNVSYFRAKKIEVKFNDEQPNVVKRLEPMPNVLKPPYAPLSQEEDAMKHNENEPYPGLFAQPTTSSNTSSSPSNTEEKGGRSNAGAGSPPPKRKRKKRKGPKTHRQTDSVAPYISRTSKQKEAMRQARAKATKALSKQVKWENEEWVIVPRQHVHAGSLPNEDDRLSSGAGTPSPAADEELTRAEKKEKKKQDDPGINTNDEDAELLGKKAPRVTKEQYEEGLVEAKKMLPKVFSKARMLAGKRVGISLESLDKINAAVLFMLQQDSRQVVLVDGPAILFGDLHGNDIDLSLYLTTLTDHVGHADPKMCTDGIRLIFMGDYVDRGEFSLEVLLKIHILKILYPDRVHLLRGNHETARINTRYGFYEELTRRFEFKAAKEMWRTFNWIFSWYPLIAHSPGRFIAMHGGGGETVAEDGVAGVNAVGKPICDPDTNTTASEVMWSDFNAATGGECGFVENVHRGNGVYFNQLGLSLILENCNVGLMVRAHQLKPSGFGMAGKGKCATVFSSSNYQLPTRNHGAILCIGEDSFTVFQLIVKDCNGDFPFREVHDARVVDAPPSGKRCSPFPASEAKPPKSAKPSSSPANSTNPAKPAKSNPSPASPAKPKPTPASPATPTKPNPSLS